MAIENYPYNNAPSIQNDGPDPEESPVKVMIVGVGGGGSNAVDNMIEANVKVNLFMAINTDKQALRFSKATRRVQIGSTITRGFGAGTDPEKGRKAADECRDTLAKLMKDMDLIFITAGMGGGTGTGAAPVIAEIARSLKKLTVAFVTTPFKFEGAHRMNNALMGIEKLREHVDSIIIVPNERLAAVTEDLSTQEAFKYADDILRQGVQALTDIIVSPGRINVDFADISTVLEHGGDAIMAIGRASGANRATEAVKRAVNNPVLDTSIEGATRAIIQVEGGVIKMSEVKQAVALITELCEPNANIVFGHAIVPELKDQLQVTIIATGFASRGAKAKTQQQQKPQVQPLQQPRQYPTQGQGTNNPYGGQNTYGGQMQQPVGQQPAQQPVQQPAPRNNLSGYVSIDDDDTFWMDRLNKKRNNNN